MMVRAFIAVRIEPPPPVAEVLRSMAAMGAAVKPVAAQNLHVTLRFLGDIDEAQFEPIVQAVREASAGVGPIDLGLAGLGAFPHADRPSVIWVGATNDRPLHAIVEELDPRIDALGFAGERREWSSHVTLGRVKAKPPAELLAMLRRMRQRSFGDVRIATVDLMRSELTPTGPIYSIISSVALG
jgi:2'-5' RNA ligase